MGCARPNRPKNTTCFGLGPVLRNASKGQIPLKESVLSRYCQELGRLGLPGIGPIGPNMNQTEEA